MESLAELRERRAFECRLTPDRALGSLDEAEAFLRDRALLTRTPDSALPSLYEACHEEPYAPGAVGFGTWPATKWPWFGALTDRGHLCVAAHRGKNLLVSPEAAATPRSDLPGRDGPGPRPPTPAGGGCSTTWPGSARPPPRTCGPSSASSARN